MKRPLSFLNGDAKPIFSAPPLLLGINLSTTSFPFGLEENTSTNSRMRLSALVLMVLMMLLVTRPGPVNCRVLASQVKVEKANPQPDKELEILRSASVKIEKANPADAIRSRVLIGNRVYTMASGPSRKGPGH